VGFRYSNGAPWILRGVSLDIEPGDHVAFIGPSGQGKSTLLEILAGVLDPSEGEVLLDGVPVRECDERSLARTFGTVVGTPLVIPGTIRENLVLRLPEAEDGEVLEAARAACFAEVVARTTDGYETCLESEGTNLSGGERQRLGLAQAFLGRPSVLFLDEATCFLDAPTEKRVIDNFLRAGVTVVSVAHRPAVIEASRQVFLVRDGRVSPTRGEPARVPAPAVSPAVAPKVVPPPRVAGAARPGVAHAAGAVAM
jgi:ATP-binding cassette subfamily B protein RaxB